MTNFTQIQSTLRLWILLDMVKLEASNFIGIQDKYVDNKRKNIEHEIKAMLHYIKKKYGLDFKRPLEDYADDVYDIFTMECRCNTEQLAKINEFCKNLLTEAVVVAPSEPA